MSGRGTLLALMIAVGGAAAAEPGLPDRGHRLLASAFENRYGCSVSAEVELVLRGPGGEERRRRLWMAAKRIDGRHHSLGQLLWPPSVRGMTLLLAEAEGRSHDAFVYLPGLDLVRRITVVQRGDAFLGSDLTYADFERQRVDHYALQHAVPAHDGSEPVVVIRAGLVAEARRQVEFVVATGDAAILEVRDFRGDAPQPFRTLVAERAGMVARGGHVLPTHLEIRSPATGTATEVWLRDLRVDPPLDDALFSTGTLARRRRLR